MGLGMRNPGCNCGITATRKSACCNTLAWCGKGYVTLDKNDGFGPSTVANTGEVEVCNPGPYKLRSTLCGRTKKCQANLAICPFEFKRMRIRWQPINHINNTTRSCIEAGGASIVRRFTEYITRSHDDIDIVMDFPYNVNCSAVIGYPIEIDLGAFSYSSGISGEANTGPGGSFLPYDYSASEAWSMKWHYNTVFPNGVQVPTFPLPMSFYEINDYDFSITYTGWTPYNPTATQCTGFFGSCTAAFGIVVNQRVSLSFMGTGLLCASVSNRYSLGVWACGVRRSKTNVLACSNCTRTDEDYSVGDNVIYRASDEVWTDIACV